MAPPANDSHPPQHRDLGAVLNSTRATRARNGRSRNLSVSYRRTNSRALRGHAPSHKNITMESAILFHPRGDAEEFGPRHVQQAAGLRVSKPDDPCIGASTACDAVHSSIYWPGDATSVWIVLLLGRVSLFARRVLTLETRDEPNVPCISIGSSFPHTSCMFASFSVCSCTRNIIRSRNTTTECLTPCGQ